MAFSEPIFSVDLRREVAAERSVAVLVEAALQVTAFGEKAILAAESALEAGESAELPMGRLAGVKTYTRVYLGSLLANL